MADFYTLIIDAGRVRQSADSDTILVGALSAVGLITGGHFKDTSLTSGRVVYVTTGGQLVDSANLTFAAATGLYVGANLGIGTAPYTYGGAGTEYILDYARVFTDATEGASKRAVNGAIRYQAPDGTYNHQYYQGGYFIVDTAPNTTCGSTGFLRGLVAAVLHRGNGTLDNCTGLLIQCGTFNGVSDSTGAIAVSMGINIYGTKTASSTIGTAYGLYIAGVAGSVAYDIYASDTGANNYLAGKTGIGALPSSTHALLIGGLGNLYMTDGTSAMRVLDMSGFGYDVAAYPVVVVGPTSGFGTVSIGYDPSGNAGASFNGNGREVLFRRGVQFVTPNSTNTDFHLFNIVLSDGHVGIGRSPTAGRMHVAAGSATAGTAPIMLTSGTLLSSGEAGAIEYNTDELYFTIYTGSARQKVVLTAGLTSGRVPYATTNGRLTDAAGLTFNGTNLNVASGTVIGTGFQLPHVVKKAASATVRNSHDAEATTISATYVKKKTITLTNGLVGAQRFLFDLKTGTSPTAAYGKIYRNGVALGTEQSDTTGGYVTKSEDITQTWNPGDTCELWAHGDGALTAYVQNFRIAYDDAPTVAVASANS